MHAPGGRRKGPFWAHGVPAQATARLPAGRPGAGTPLYHAGMASAPPDDPARRRRAVRRPARCSRRRPAPAAPPPVSRPIPRGGRRDARLLTADRARRASARGALRHGPRGLGAARPGRGHGARRRSRRPLRRAARQHDARDAAAPIARSEQVLLVTRARAGRLAARARHGGGSGRHAARCSATSAPTASWDTFAFNAAGLGRTAVRLVLDPVMGRQDAVDLARVGESEQVAAGMTLVRGAARRATGPPAGALLTAGGGPFELRTRAVHARRATPRRSASGSAASRRGARASC